MRILFFGLHAIGLHLIFIPSVDIPPKPPLSLSNPILAFFFAGCNKSTGQKKKKKRKSQVSFAKLGVIATKSGKNKTRIKLTFSDTFCLDGMDDYFT